MAHLARARGSRRGRRRGHGTEGPGNAPGREHAPDGRRALHPSADRRRLRLHGFPGSLGPIARLKAEKPIPSRSVPTGMRSHARVALWIAALFATALGLPAQGGALKTKVSGVDLGA